MARRIERKSGVGRVLLHFSAVAVVAAAGALLLASPVHAQVDPSAAEEKVAATEVREGRLYNLTSQPFRFQLHQADGAAWTNAFVVHPGKYYAIHAPRNGEFTDIQGLTGNGRGFVIIRYPEPVLGGNMTVRLPAMNPANQRLQPTWFAIKDSSGITRLVQEGSAEEAKAVQEALQKQAPLSPEEIERTKHMLRSNWVLTN